MALITTATDRIFVTKIEQLITDLAQKHKVYAHTRIKTRCPNCMHDAVQRGGAMIYNGTGPRPFDGQTCPVCFNEGFVGEQERRIRITGVPRFDKPKEEQILSAGTLEEGKPTLKALIRFRKYLQNATRVEIDGNFYRVVGDIRDRGLLTKVVCIVLLEREE